VSDAFRKVQEAITNAPESILRDAGIRHHKHGSSYTIRNEWNSGFLCAKSCGDKSGSASFTRELFHHCHQCGDKSDVFDWLAAVNGTDPWTECKRLAQTLNIDINVKKLPGTRSMPQRMTEDIASAATRELIEGSRAKAARDFLTQRGLWNPRAIEEIGLGCIQGYIVFPQRTASGELLDRRDKSAFPARPEVPKALRAAGVTVVVPSPKDTKIGCVETRQEAVDVSAVGDKRRRNRSFCP